MKELIKNRLNVMLFIGIIVLYIAFLSLDIFLIPRSIHSRYLKYASIVLCLMLASSFAFESENKCDSNYVVLALSFTLMADTFLLFTPHQITGVFFFCLVQLTYLKRYNTQFFKAGVCFSVIAAIVYLLFPFPSLYVIAGLYAILIGSCFLSTFHALLPKFNLYGARMGMFLFILCDIHVALYHQRSPGSPYYRFVTVAMWLFYLPSQFLLAVSAAYPKVGTHL